MKAFLDSLIGLSVDKAEKLVGDYGFFPIVTQPNDAYSSIARPNQIFLVVENDVVCNAEPGDPCQVIK